MGKDISEARCVQGEGFLGRIKYLNLIFAVIGIILILLGILVIDGLIFKAIFTFVGVILLILIDPSSREYDHPKVTETPFMHDPRYYYKERYKGFVPERFIDIPPGIIITFILGWIFIIIGCYGTSTYLDYQHDGSMFPIYDRVEPEYSISAIIASIGIIILGICHLLMFVKIKSIPSVLAAIFLGISGIVILLYI